MEAIARRENLEFDSGGLGPTSYQGLSTFVHLLAFRNPYISLTGNSDNNEEIDECIKKINRDYGTDIESFDNTREVMIKTIEEVAKIKGVDFDSTINHSDEELEEIVFDKFNINLDTRGLGIVSGVSLSNFTGIVASECMKERIGDSINDFKNLEQNKNLSINH